MKLHAWLHDIEPTEWGVRLHWLPENNVKPIEVFFPFTAEFYITKADRETQAQLLSHSHIDRVDIVPRFRFIHDWKPVDVLQVKVNPNHLQSTYFDLRKYWDDYLHNADLSLYQHFCFQMNLFPYVYAEIEIFNNRLQPNWRLLEEYTDKEYRTVPFRTLWLQPKFENEHLLRGRLLVLSVRRSIVDSEEEPVIFEDPDEGTMLEECFRYIRQIDPDIIFTRGGDTFFPVLAQHALQAGVGRIHPGRGPRTLQSYIKRPNTQRGHSYASYGRIYFSQHGIYFDGGRHHYDVGNSFMYKDGNIEGIHELVRLGCSNPQRIARGTIGTTLTAVQMRTAYYQHILIPARKADAEHFRPAWSLASDVGGLVFSPDVGLHLNVTEYDFLSMYPNIMVHRNVSPETVNCSCCQEEAEPVPLTDHTICVRRPGLVSLALENILNRREYFKSKKKEHQRYERRQKVLKWLLVTCFGYQGYRNARFGRIEAHEAISAYGRDVLTQTQHLVAKNNLKVIAGIVDSIWVKREDDSIPIDSVTISQLREQIEQTVRLPVEHAADYHWIVFLPRRHDPAIGVLNRYYGLRKDGTFKVRGIEIRQSSAPLIVKNFQTQVLKFLASARTQTQFKQRVFKAKKLLIEHKDRLKQEDVSLSELIITIHTSRSPDEYVNKSRQAIAAKQFSNLGVNVEPGMKVDFILTDVNAQDPMRRVKIKQLLRGDERYDAEEYCKLLDRAYENLIPPELEEQHVTLELFWNNRKDILVPK